MSRRPSPTLCLITVALCLGTVRPAVAEDTNPFQKIDEERARQRERQRRAGAVEPERPSLPPMGGVGTRPWQQPEGRDGRADGHREGEAGSSAARGGPIDPDRPEGGRALAQRPAVPPPIERAQLPPPDEKARAVERSDLGPAMAGDGSGVPVGLWQGAAGADIEKLVLTLPLPARSPTMADLWRRIWRAEEAGVAEGEPGRFEALAIEALLRAGLVREALQRAEKVEASAPGVLPAIAARARIAAGDLERGCGDVRTIARRPDLPKPVRGEMLLLGGLCAAIAGDPGAAQLAAELARAQEVSAPFPLAVLDAVAAGQKEPPALPRRLGPVDGRYLDLLPGSPIRGVLERAEPALAGAIAGDEARPPAERILAAEVAAGLNALDAEQLAAAWRRAPATAALPAEGAAPGGQPPAAEPGLRRAVLFRAIEAERTPLRKVRLARQLLDEGRRVGLATPVAILLSRATEGLAPVAEIGWFAETAIEVHLVAGRHDLARRWIEAADRERFDRGGSLAHWLVLVDLADPAWPGRRGEALAHAEQLSLRGRLTSDLLHRLATVLDALDYQIPIPLWEAASRTPQPRTGHLPETGVLTRLKDAAKAKDHARTVLLSFETLGPSGAEQANIIALGDVIRALRRAGLEADARRLALEAVLPAWPRQQGG